MTNLQNNLLSQFHSSIDDLLKNIDLTGKTEDQINKLKLFLEDSLGDRIILFILENLSSKGLEEYERLIAQEEADISKINELIYADVGNFADLLKNDLIKFAKESLENIN